MTAGPNDLGILGASRREGAPTPVPSVLVVNLCDAAGRKLADLWADPLVLKVEYPSLDALLAEWEPD